MEKDVKDLITEEVNEGVSKGFKGVVDGGFVEEHIANTVEIAGLTTETDDLEAEIVTLKNKIENTALASAIVWLSCVALFIARFII